MNYYSKANNKQGFRDLTYNEEFYETLSKNLVLPIIHQTNSTQLIKMINQNQNAAVSSTTGQLIDGLDDVVRHKTENKNDIDKIGDKIVTIGEEVKVLDTEIREDYYDDIVELRKEYNKHLLIQNKENAKLQREVDNYSREVNDLQTQIYYLLGKINLMEREIGIKNKDYALYEDNLIVGTEEARFIIITENI
jgi:hypothetical protein